MLANLKLNSAKFEINLPYALREQILEAQRKNQFDLETFDHAYEDMKNHLLNDGFSRFLKTLDGKRKEMVMSLHI